MTGRLSNGEQGATKTNNQDKNPQPSHIRFPTSTSKDGNRAAREYNTHYIATWEKERIFYILLILVVHTLSYRLESEFGNAISGKYLHKVGRKYKGFNSL